MDKPTKTLNEVVAETPATYQKMFFVLGLINNNGYTMVHAGSSSLAESFGKKSLMGYFLFFMRFAGVLSRYVNGAFCVNIPHVMRIGMVTISIFMLR